MDLNNIEKAIAENKIIVICGPTASGKSNFANFLAARYNGVIINADAMQIYQEIPIITAQPNKTTQNLYPHKLYGFISIIADAKKIKKENVFYQTKDIKKERENIAEEKEEIDFQELILKKQSKYDSKTKISSSYSSKSAENKFSVAKWLDLCIKEIFLALKNDKNPIIVGGSGMYLNCLINGLAKVPDINKQTIMNIEEIYAQQGIEFLYELLQCLDFEFAKNIHHLDSQRIIRGLSVVLQTKIPLSVWHNYHLKSFSDNSFLIIYIKPNREQLYENINERTLAMIEDGAIEEVKNLLYSHLLSNVIGFEDLKEYLLNNITLPKAILNIQQKTRNYAKRQQTWFKNKLKADLTIDQLI